MKLLSFEKSVGAVVVNQEKGTYKFLVLQYRSGQWDFPKGHIEAGESETETLRRELMEETAITQYEFVEGFRNLVRYYYKAKGNELAERKRENKGVYIFKQVAYYAIFTKHKDVVLNHENHQFQWLDYKTALSRLKNKSSKRILTKLYSKLNKIGA